MMACSYLSASGSGMKTASTSAACWTPPAMPGCSIPEMEGSSMLPAAQTFMRPPGLLRLMTPPSFAPSLPPLGPTPSGITLTPPGLAPTPSGLMSTPPTHVSTPLNHMPTSAGHMPTPSGHMPTPTGHMMTSAGHVPAPASLMPAQPGLTQEPALDLTTTPSLKAPSKSSPSDDDTE